MAAKFTWQEKFTRVIERVPEKDQGALSLAIIRYGTYGEEPDLSYPLDAIFESVKEDIDYSVSARANGSRGGKGNRKEGGGQSETPLETPLIDSANPPSEEAEAKTIHSNTEQDSTKKDSKRTRFKPPTPEQVAEYAAEKGFALDPHRFCDFYASKGWKVGSSPMKDWKAAVRTWARRDSKGVGPDEEAQRYASLV